VEVPARSGLSVFSRKEAGTFRRVCQVSDEGFEAVTELPDRLLDSFHRLPGQIVKGAKCELARDIGAPESLLGVGHGAHGVPVPASDDFNLSARQVGEVGGFRPRAFLRLGLPGREARTEGASRRGPDRRARRRSAPGCGRAKRSGGARFEPRRPQCRSTADRSFPNQNFTVRVVCVEGWKERAGRNEAIFREVNESIARLEERLISGSDSLPIICECARAECATQIEIGLSEYENVRQHPDRFIVARGHEQPNIEQILAQEAEYLIVEKVGIAAAAADDAS
jgi:hypothetical protein